MKGGSIKKYKNSIPRDSILRTQLDLNVTSDIPAGLLRLLNHIH